MIEINEIEVSGRQLASMFKVSDRRIRQLADQGVVVRGSKAGRYALAASVEAYVSEIREASQDEAGSLLVEMRRQKLEREKLKGRVADGDLLPLEAFNAFARSVTRALERSASILEKALFPVFRDAAKVNPIINGYHADLAAWLTSAEDAILKGATRADIDEMFADSATPPKHGRVRSKTKAKTKENSDA